MIISLVGVHGVGKTRTARVLAKVYNFKHRSIEAIDSAYGLDPVSRQLMFLSVYVKRFLDIHREWLSSPNCNIVVDSHPLLVLPYTEYWLMNAGLERREINDIISGMTTLIKRLPKVDAIVYISPTNIYTVLKRISIRNHFNIAEELKRNYVEFIDSWLKSKGIEIMKEIAKTTLTIPAEWNGNYRAAEIVRRLNISTRPRPLDGDGEG